MILIIKVEEKAILIFEAIYSNTIAIFAFDNFSSHSTFAANALNAKAMNVNLGGKQPIMRDTIFNEQVQHIVFSDDYSDSSLRKLPKGMKIILQECDLWK